jgi:glutamyl-tRNA synthetase
MRTPDGDVRGAAEPDFADAGIGSVVQFERIGFGRVDDRGDGETVVYWSHP